MILLLKILPLFLLFFGLIGIFISRRNIVLLVICLEILLLAMAYHFLLIGYIGFGDYKAILLCLLILCLGAAESAVALGLAISYIKKY